MALSQRSPRLFRCSGLLAALLLGSCGGGAAEPRGSGYVGGEHPGEDGAQDRASGGGISVQEQAIRVALAGRTLEVSIPVEPALSKAVSGKLSVELVPVGKSEPLDSALVAYSLDGGEGATLRARLTLPEGVTGQAALVDYNLHVRHLDSIGVHVQKSAFAALPRFEAHLDGPARVSLDKTVSYRVRAHDPETFAPIADAPVALTLKDQDGALVRELSGSTDELGDAFFDVQLDQQGALAVAASVQSAGATAALTSSVSVEGTSARAMLTTDKPLYQPGQTVHLRALALTRADNAPFAGQDALFEIEDAKANKVLKRSVKTDSFGIAATTFQLGTLVNLGTFKARVVLGSVQSERGFEVARYALPKFALDASLDKSWYRAGETLHGRVDARYFFGKNVVGADVLLEASSLDVGSNVFQRVMGKTDADGRIEFSVTLPPALAGLPLEQGNALLGLHLKVTDAAGQTAEKDVPVVAAAEAARVTLVPEATKLVAGAENRLFAFVSDPVGAPIAGATIHANLVGGQEDSAQSDAFGQAELRLTPSANQSEIQATLELPGGGKLQQTFSFAQQGGVETVLVRSDRAVYAVGDSATIEIITSDRSGAVYVDWLNEGQTVDQRTLTAQDGKASFEVAIDGTLLGSNRVDAYIVDVGGNVVRAGRSLFVRSDAALSVELATDKSSYLPGEPAQLTFSVRDEHGAPQAAALGVQIVDEALFSLSAATPGLLRAYFELDDAFSTPHYQIAAPAVSLPTLVFDETREGSEAELNAAQRRAAAAFAALDASMLTGIQAGSWVATKSEVNRRLSALFADEKTRLSERLRPAVKVADITLGAKGCSAQVFYCNALGDQYPALLAKEVDKQLQLFDVWGQPYRRDLTSGGDGLGFVSRGPDELTSTWDDQNLRFSWSDLGIQTLGAGSLGGVVGGPAFEGDRGLVPGVANAGAAGAGGGAAGGTTGGTTGGAPQAEAPAPRVRSDFPETLYVNPAVITGPDGTAKLQVPLADSITQWRVSSMANSRDGKLGGAAHGLTVFQDFFVDINFPAQLTRGDEVSFPVAIYNYLDQPQDVSIVLQAASWYSARGASSATVHLAAGAVAGVSFPVQVNDVGLQKLRVTAQGSARSDALERSVRVIPDGKAFPLAQSGALGAGSAQHSVSYPSNAVPGSGTLELSVYPAFLSSVVSGMDSMLREPFGCFEQTTSTTWPNVLVQSYLSDTRQLTPETQLKAEAYISAGYQRLMTYEHPGGGFSWFGTQDGHPFLSVTAFGVMEFVDMAKVYPVDPAMLARTVTWLAAQQKPDGTFPGDRTEFFSFNTSVLRNTAFVAWSLATAGEHDSVTRALDYLGQHYDDEAQDAYTLALVANAFASADPSSSTLDTVLERLDSMAKSDGDKLYWDSGTTQTTFYSQGADAQAATTALVAHALLLVGGHADKVKGALDYLAAARDKQGNFGSTQATIWTLRALLLAASKGSEGAVGTLSVAVDGEAFRTLELSEDQSDVMTQIDLSSFAGTGAHEVLLNFAGSGKLSYNLVSSYNLPWSSVPAASAGPLSVTVSYDRTSLPVNDLVSASVAIENLTDASQNMVLVDVGIPPGFELQTEDLDALLASQLLSKYELTPRQLILYVSALAPRAHVQVPYRLRATMPVKAADGGAKVYPYYEPTRVSQAASVVLEAKP